jgi:hypothetical protein
MTRSNAIRRLGAALIVVSVAAPSLVSAQQAQAPSVTRPAQVPSGGGQTATATASARRPGRALQGFSVVLVMGDLQGTSATDDVPVAARKALTDMREFLPYKSYRLLDAGWLMCCGDEPRSGPAERRMANELSTLALRGPDEQEYDVKLSSRTEGGRVLVRFLLFRLGSSAVETAASNQAVSRSNLQRRLADLEDRAQLQQKQVAEARRRVEVGTAPATDIPKLEVELRTTQREIEDLKERVASGGGGRSSAPRETAPRFAPSAVIDTSFTMDVGETVVVGASRPRGAAKALIALVTAVPRGGTTGVTRD